MSLKTITAAVASNSSESSIHANSFPIGGSDFYSRVAIHVRTLNDPSEDFITRYDSFRWLRKQYGDWQEVDGPLESAIRSVTEERSEIGRKLQPYRAILECRDTLIRVGALLPQSEATKAAALLSPYNDATERLKALEGLVTFYQTGLNEEHEALSKRALTIIIETLNREQLRKEVATLAEVAVEIGPEQRFYGRLMELSLVLGLVSS